MRVERFADALERAARAARSVVPRSVVPPASAPGSVVPGSVVPGSVVPPASAPGSQPAPTQTPTPAPPPPPAPATTDPALVTRLDRMQQSLDDLRTDETSFRSLVGFEK